MSACRTPSRWEAWNLVLGPEIGWKFSDDEWSLGLNSGVTFDF